MPKTTNNEHKPFDWEAEYLEKQGDAWEEERTLTEMTDEEWDNFLDTILKSNKDDQTKE